MEANDSRQCRRCVYRTQFGSDYRMIACYYIVCEYERRGCPIEGCTRFQPGPPKRRISNGLEK